MVIDPVAVLAQTDFNHPVFAIRLPGLTAVSENALIPSLSTKVGRKTNAFNLKRDIETLFLTGLFRQVEANPVVSNNVLTLDFVVNENPTVSAIVFEGNTVFSSETLRPLIQNRPGMVLNIRSIETDKTALETWYRDHGYDLFVVVDISLDADRVLHYHLQEGRIGKILFVGIDQVRAFVLDRELVTQPDTVFNSKTLREDRDRLLRLGYFSDVSPPILQESLDKTKPNIVFKVQEKKLNLMDFGIEQERDIVVAFAKLDLQQRLIPSDFTRLKVQSDYQYGRVGIRSYSLSYLQPWFLNWIPVSFATDAWNELKQEYLVDKSTNTRSLKDNKRTGYDVILGVPLIRDRMTLSSKFKSESVSIIQSDGSYAPYYDIRTLGLALSYRQLDDKNNPKSGLAWSLEGEKGGYIAGLNLGGLTFTRTSAETILFLKQSDVDTLGFHLAGGMIFGASSISTFETDSFELGGAASLRGYKETNPFTGSRKILANIEYRHDFNPVIQGVLFYDVGQAFSTGAVPYPLHQGYGFGTRFFTPIGALRFDLAWGEAFMIHFGLGQVF
ncbi:MAG: outer membrane protein assembly factor [Candidatus Margulisiibacteriota bacterium]